jgi:hypothetical protein
MYKAVEDYLKAYGKNPDQYLDQPAFINQALTLWQEIQICAQGEVPPMSMTDNHTEKAEGLMAFLESPEYQEALGKGFYTKEIEQWIGRTVAKHEGLAQALQPKGQPNPTGEQGQDYSALMSASAPQQQQIGGPNVQSSGEAPAGAGNSEAVSSAGVGGSGGDRGSVAA